MTFDELWGEINKLRILPDTAIYQIPSILSDDTKDKLALKSPEEAVRIITDSIHEINHGSVETVNSLVRKRL